MYAGAGMRGMLVATLLGSAIFLVSGPEPVCVGRTPVSEELGTGDRAVPAVDAAARSAGADESWWKAVSQQIARDEYQASSTDRGLQAPNRAHNLRTYFRESGIEVVPRSGGELETWRFTWQTTRWGRSDDLAATTPAATGPQANGARVTYARGSLEEWYENKPQGLEQGFTVRERPEGDGELLIEGRIGGDLRAELTRDADAVDLLDANGVRVLRYAGLVVRDAGDREVPSRLSLVGDAVAIVIADAGATYPLTVDPLMTSPAWTAESDQASAYFGCSVATAGDVNGDGYSDVIVGASGYDNGEIGEGRAFVYHGSAEGLVTTPAWTAESDQDSAYFGVSVGTAGDVNGDGYSDVIVGAHGYDNGQYFEGCAYVYHGSPGGLGVSPAWRAEGDKDWASLGVSVGTAGDVNGDGYSDVIVGAFQYESDSYHNAEGQARVYHGSSGGLAATPAWTRLGGQAFAHFGYSVGTAGDVNGDGYADVIVGARAYDNGQTDEGRAYVFHGSSGGLGASPAWTAESDQEGAQFGYTVGTAGDVNGDGYADIIVGARYYDNGETDEGRAYVYYGSSAGLAAGAAWTAEGDQASAGFGRVAAAGDVNGDGYADVIVGAAGYDNGQTDEGRAFVYHGSAGGLAAGAAWIKELNQASAWFGCAVATAGDVNGDGYSDVIVGARYYDAGWTDEGWAFVYHGSSAGLATTAAWTASGQQNYADFGFSVGTAGDVNGDGYADVIVGADTRSNGQADEGRAYVYHGSPGGLTATPAWTGESDQASAHFGCSVGTAGDVNGDGYSDVIIGASYYDNGETNEGRAFVYLGSSSGLAASAAWTAESDQASALFGYSVGTAGDVNGDGYSDVIVGARLYDNVETSEGRAYVYQGSSGGLAATPAWAAEGNQESACFGGSVATAGDVNGDGYSDVIVGARSYSNGESSEGRAYVYQGSPAGLAETASWTAEGNQATAYFATSVGTAGDVNGDGYSDVIVGSDSYRGDLVSEGAAFVYLGSPGGLAASAAWMAEGDQTQSYFGCSVGTAGDVNGDGYSDVIVGAQRHDNGQTDEGRAYVYCGNDGGGLDRIPRQARTDDSAPISPLGCSDSQTGFRLKVVGRTPAGQGELRLQYEVKPAGIPFDGNGLVTGAWTNTRAAADNGNAVELSELVSDLSPGTLYHWRLRIQSDSPYFPWSPWLWLPYNSLAEADVRTAVATGVAESSGTPALLLLGRAMPNPFSSATTLSYTLPGRGHVRLGVYDVRGREVAVLADEAQDGGLHTVRWDGSSARGAKLPAGVYFARLAFAGREEARKIVLTR